MLTFTKAQIASIIATGVDFGVTFLLLRFTGVAVVACGAAGTLCGGATHFLISRNWVFQAQEGRWAAQLHRYVLVWIGNFLLNVSGLWMLTHYTGLNGMLAKVLTAVTVAIGYNYVLQKRFVFK